MPAVAAVDISRPVLRDRLRGVEKVMEGLGPTGIVLYVYTVVYSWYGLESPPKKHKYFPQFFCTAIFNHS